LEWPEADVRDDVQLHPQLIGIGIVEIELVASVAGSAYAAETDAAHQLVQSRQMLAGQEDVNIAGRTGKVILTPEENPRQSGLFEGTKRCGDRRLYHFGSVTVLAGVGEQIIHGVHGCTCRSEPPVNDPGQAKF
jgi:hypothetical protein